MLAHYCKCQTCENVFKMLKQISISIQIKSILFKLTQWQCIRESYNYYSSVININIKNIVKLENEKWNQSNLQLIVTKDISEI